MGRKIPGKKHRGVKNPHEQQKIRTESIKNKINSPPVDIDDQPIPESLKRLAQWTKLGCKEMKIKKMENKKAYRSWLSGEPKTKQQKKNISQKARPTVAKRPGENEKDFLDRLFKETSKERKLELKRSGSKLDEPVNSSKKVKGDVELIISNAGGKLKGKETTTDDEYLSKKERKKRLLAAKKQEKMEKMQELQDEDDIFKDHVEFGEIVHAPPVLSLPLRNKTKIEDAKLGHRRLELDKMLTQTCNTYSTKPRLKTKMKHMGAKQRELLESARLQVVESYRRLKKQNHHS